MNRVVNVRAVLAVTVAGAAVLICGCRRSGPATPAQPKAAANAAVPPANAVGPFFVGVSSLDVEANERAARLFEELSRQIPDEPAVWANLGLARLKLGDVPGAGAALVTATKLAPGNGAILLLQATVDEDEGQFERAIERLQTVPNPEPAVLYRIAQLFERTGRDADLKQELGIYDRILQAEPGNLVVAFNRARLLARLQDKPELIAAVGRLESFRGAWAAAALHQLEAAKTAANDGNFRMAATSLAFLQNLTLPTPDYRATLARLGVTGQAIGRPVRRFLKYGEPLVAVAEPDLALRFETRPGSTGGGPPDFVAAFALSAKPAPSLVTVAQGVLRVGTQAGLPLPGGGRPAGRHAVCTADLNGDYLEDLAYVDHDGLKLWLQDREGRFSAYETPAEIRPLFQAPGTGVWAIDFEADGDLDLLVARSGAAPQLLRNNGDGTYAAVNAFAAFPEIRDLCWADFDGDGVDDAVVLDATGRVLVSWNDRAGSFTPPQPVIEGAVAVAAGDLTGTGDLGLVVLARSGALRRVTFDHARRTWSTSEFAQWTGGPDLGAAFAADRASVMIADLDNNGAADVIASAGNATAIWLNRGGGELVRLGQTPALFVTSVADLNGDGLLDLVGVTARGAAVAQTAGSKHYHWQSIQTRTLASQADSRINSFGLGGRIEVRAGPLLASAPIVSPHTHFGLGEQTEVGLARIVWPNGTAQVEFSPAVDQQVTATQRLKGSCPWVFTRVGDTLHFVKDFIWRSPLGMRINSQDTAGVDQTEDWILIPGESLRPDGGQYEVRITAELWETHFFDHVSLRTVDHPTATSVFVDERFVPTAPPKLAVIATTTPQPLAALRDEAGRDASAVLAVVDGQYLDTFPLGRYQGIAAEHWVEFEVPANAPLDRPLALIGTGWIYPTDSSLNVAISQGRIAAPHGLVLDEFDAPTGWRPASGELGFPAGKNKNVVIPLPASSLAAGHRRFRLRTNLEIYWDRLAWVVELPDAPLKIATADTRLADLRYHGFSDLDAPQRRKPDLPAYAKFSPSGPRWQDLEGFYTRFGDVRELLQAVDDRYVIMNAGDEMVLRFAAPPPPPAGWTRDFVLVGDGWVKDGDFNTANSRTVLPLPSHAVHSYGSPTVSLETDPVFQHHAQDWLQYHTRYVTPFLFERGLMAGAAAPATKAPTP